MQACFDGTQGGLKSKSLLICFFPITMMGDHGIVVTPLPQHLPTGCFRSGTGMPLAQQLLLYGLVVVGVLFSEAVAMARRGGPIRVELSWPWVAVACVVALVVFPAIWRDVGTMAGASLLVQMGLATQGGVFWGVLMAGAEKQARR